MKKDETAYREQFVYDELRLLISVLVERVPELKRGDNFREQKDQDNGSEIETRQSI